MILHFTELAGHPLNRRIKIALCLCVGITVVGTTGYMFTDGYCFSEALYMTIITVSTVGFSEIHPLSEAGRYFTIFIIITGLSTLAYTGHALAESLLENVWSDYSEIKKMKRDISLLKAHYIICGFGRVGQSAADHFNETGAEFVIIEADPRHCQMIKEKGYKFVEGDATHESVLLDAGIKKARGLLALLNTDPDNLFITLTARELNPTIYLIARSEHASGEKKIYQAGADSVVSPFASAGRRIARDILSVTIGKETQALETQTVHKIVSYWINAADSGFSGRTIAELEKELDKNVFGLRRDGQDVIQPAEDIIIENSDELLVQDIGHSIEEDYTQRSPVAPKIAIVDDNQVILGLYTRLFKRAGFHPITANNGKDGLDMILDEKPVAAVVEFKLRGLSGIDLCKAVRKDPDCKDMKIILFSVDSTAEVQQQAMDAGMDAVVLKSPEASEVIDTVIQQLRKL